jgi:hypothetical protein
MLMRAPMLAEPLHVDLAAILPTAIRVVDHPGSHLALGYGHLQSLKREAAVHVSREAPANALTRISIEQARQIHKTLRQTHIGQIGDPALIERFNRKLFDQVAVDWLTVLRIGGMNKARLALAHQPGLLHHSFDTLVINLPPVALERFGHAAISISSKVFAQLLQLLGQRLIPILLRSRTSVLILPLSVDVEERTQPAD